MTLSAKREEGSGWQSGPLRLRRLHLGRGHDRGTSRLDTLDVLSELAQDLRELRSGEVSHQNNATLPPSCPKDAVHARS